jgi:transcriptional regulator with XRE-family HTH domain
LKALRKAKGWTQVQMADALGIDRSYISDMERGKKNTVPPSVMDRPDVIAADTA